MQKPQNSGTPAVSRKLLETYLADHLAGSTAGCARMSRMADAYSQTPDGDKLTEISHELRRERSFLKRIMQEQGFGPHYARQFIAWFGERLGRLKGNGHIVAPSPLTPLLELEVMRSAVSGKVGLWQTLQANAPEVNVDPRLMSSFIVQAKRQLEALERVHEHERTCSIRDEPEAVRECGVAA